jgi:hypothetical protein
MADVQTISTFDLVPGNEPNPPVPEPTPPAAATPPTPPAAAAPPAPPDQGDPPAAPPTTGDDVADRLVAEIKRALSVQTAEGALTSAIEAFDTAQAMTLPGDPALLDLEAAMVGCEFDLLHAQSTSEGLDALQARVEQLEFDAESKVIEQDQTKNMPRHFQRVTAELIALQTEATRINGFIKDRKVLDDLNAQAESAATKAMADLYKAQDEARIAELEATPDIEVWEVEMAKAEAQLPPAVRRGYAKALATQIEEEKAKRYTAMRKDYVAKRLTRSGPVTPPVTMEW